MINSVCFVVAKPVGLEQGSLGIRSAWACHQNGFETRIIYSEDGVWCLTGNPGYHTSMLNDFVAEEGEVYAIREDLERRGIAEDDLIDGVEVVDAADVVELCEEMDSVNYF
ncbi:DsrH/TusB family sulfur metabolism protein [Salidesulfovibrio onnuriiensis]|uniref:DsrH/TusB family sulfur metabolism protein n=1 Tax=Salidesulfovibrio onnuriiensis TaxID=2583823 RepID=UPI0011C88AA7|nr:DsrH/TusB family sulfur metabolism protein [Salidesulfovibrio onnuriiensis]